MAKMCREKERKTLRGLAAKRAKRKKGRVKTGQRRFWEGFWGRVLRRVLRRGGYCGFYSKTGF